MVKCSECGIEIPAERLEALPDTDTCIKCSRVKKAIGYMVPTASKGCAPVLMRVSDDPESQRQADNANRRKR